MALTAYITATPLDSGKFKDIYSSIKEFKSRFKERFELDHYMGGVVDDTDPTCEGYHKQLTMNGGEYNATNIPATIPACPTGGIVFFSIGGELCCYDGSDAVQLTNGNELITETIEINLPTAYNYKILYAFKNDLAIVALLQESGGVRHLYSSIDNGITWTLKSQVSGLKLLECNGVFFYGYTNSAGVYYSLDGSTWSHISGISGALGGVCHDGSKYIITTWTSQTTLNVYSSINLSSFTLIYTNSSVTLAQRSRPVYGNGKYYITGAQGVYSDDGTNWNTGGHSTVLNNEDFAQLKYNGSLFFIKQNSTSNEYVQSSSDFVNWTNVGPKCSGFAFFFDDMILTSGSATEIFRIDYSGGYKTFTVMQYLDNGFLQIDNRTFWYDRNTYDNIAYQITIGLKL